jgi:phenylpropionate dioxygenase-like ring-hydroxylating dioxygenase large terminal subunit
MLTALQNDRLTSVEGAAPMARLIRENFWIPFSRIEGLEATAPPARTRLLGKDYVAFRAPDGRIGFFNEGCPHRGVSLALARVEGCALRCIFHGWKIDASGKVLEVPSEGDQSEVVAARIKVRHYPTVEDGGLIWVFLGDSAPPPFPRFPFCGLPKENIWATRTIVSTNWLQGLEAALDSSHVGFLHRSWMNMGNTDGDKISVVPRYSIENTSYGMRAAASRSLGDEKVLLRVSEYFLPFIAMTPGALNRPGRESSIFMAVPVDNLTHLLFWGLFNTGAPVGDQRAFFSTDPNPDLDNFATFSGTRADNWGQDRAAMKNGHFSGFTRHLLQEDVVVQISMGAVADRTNETLCKSDLAIARCRALLLQLLDRFEAGQEVREIQGSVGADTLPIGAIVRSDFDWRQDPSAAE